MVLVFLVFLALVFFHFVKKQDSVKKEKGQKRKRVKNKTLFCFFTK